MWHIGQLLQNKEGERVLFAGFDFDKKPSFAYFRLRDGELEKFREDGVGYRNLPGEPAPIGKFALMLNAGFFGELDLRKLKSAPIYVVAIDTLRGVA